MHRISRRKRLVGAAIAGLVVLLALAALKLTTGWPGPPLPAGATRLAIVTEPAHVIPTLGCPLALLAPARVATAGDELVLLNEATGERDAVVWPSGWVAWRIGGRAELVASDGSIFAREGDVLEHLGGGLTGGDDAFHICIIGR